MGGETTIREKQHITDLENNAKKLIADMLVKYDEYEPTILTSGGKDSSVTLHLTRSVLNGCKAIFNNTSLDCWDTYKHIKTIDNLSIINPKEGFYQWRKRLDFIPTRFSRACCTIFKEGAMINVLPKEKKYLFFMGMRNSESATRSSYQDEWKNNKWCDNWQGILPIRTWSDYDVWLYIIYHNIDICSKYKKGYHRVGCHCACPYYTKSTWVLDDYWYPNMRKRWLNILTDDFHRMVRQQY